MTGMSDDELLTALTDRVAQEGTDILRAWGWAEAGLQQGSGPTAEDLCRAAAQGTIQHVRQAYGEEAIQGLKRETREWLRWRHSQR